MWKTLSDENQVQEFAESYFTLTPAEICEKKVQIMANI